MEDYWNWIKKEKEAERKLEGEVKEESVKKKKL